MTASRLSSFTLSAGYALASNPSTLGIEYDRGMRCALALLLFLAGCGGGAGSGDDDGDGIDSGVHDNGTVFDPGITAVTIEVDYESGVEPYTGAVVGFGDTWDLTASNMGRLFAGHKALDIPRTLSDMQDIGAVADEEITVTDALAIADAHRDAMDTATTKTYYVVFVSGAFADASGPNNAVLGVSIGNTGVIVMFKDVIESTGIAARFVEQSTLVHELGHAVGLVNNGVPLASAHEDPAHSHHCANDNCVLFWQNDGPSAMAAFAENFVINGESILFGDECLADVDAITGGP